MVIFDEVHRTTGDYAYSSIAKHFEDTDTRLLGMTATLPSEQEKATEIFNTIKNFKVLLRELKIVLM